MADALASFVVDQLTDEIKQKVRLVVGVENEISKLTKTFKVIQAVLKDADNKQFKDELVKLWLEEFKDVAYDMDDVLDEWRTEMLIKSQIEGIQTAPRGIGMIKKVICFLLSLCSCIGEVGLRHDIGGRIEQIRERVDSIANEKDKYHLVKTNNNYNGPEHPVTCSLIDESVVCGRNIEKDFIISKLLGDSGAGSSTSSSSQQETSLSHPIVISIVGMGGLGKTTLAQLVINNERLKNHFEKTMWVFVSDPFDRTRLAKAIIQGAGGVVQDNLEWEELLKSLSKSVEGKRFLLVLDDVWNEDDSNWEHLQLALKSAAQGSRILVTTRNEKVANIMNSTYIYDLKILSENDCWSLIRRIAFVGRDKQEQETLTDIGVEIAKKCKGLPLAAKALGSLLRFKRTENDWENVLKSEIWEIEEVENNFLKPALLLSYFDLPASLKPCFTYCSIFPKDFDMNKDVLIRLWMAQGFLNSRDGRKEDLEMIGEEYFNNLVLRSFFQDIKFENGNISTCKIHDLLHDFAQFLMKNECGIIRRSDSHCNSKIRHLSLIPQYYPVSSFHSSIYKAKNLRTFQLLETFVKELPPIFLSSFNCLRVLCLGDCGLKYFSSDVGKLIHLRYLDLSHNKKLTELPESITTLYNLQTLDLAYCRSLCKLPEEMWRLNNLRYLDLSHNKKLTELPESITTLYNLQTLDLAYCRSLCKLPEEMWRLNNLRHLNIEWCFHLKYLPQGIGKLTSLRTLTKFPLSGTTRGSCKIEELKDLNHLRGELEISGLGGGVRTTKSEASEARLKNKNHLRVLQLEFIVGIEAGHIDVLEGLQPHPKLEKMILLNYMSSKFPSWIGDNSILSHVKVLELYGCKNCIEFPALGRLPSLEELHIKGMDEIKQIGLPDGTCVVMQGEKLFPKLRKLDLWRMANLEELLGNDVAAAAAEEEEGGGIEIMPCLEYLRINICPKLKSLPRKLVNLQELDYNYSPALSQWSSLLPKLKVLDIRCLNGHQFGSSVAARILPQGLLSQLKTLERLGILYFPELICIPDEEVRHLTNLQKLSIKGCPNLICIPEQVRHLTNLQELDIRECEKLMPRCRKGEGEDWSIISHIPNIFIDEVKIQ